MLNKTEPWLHTPLAKRWPVPLAFGLLALGVGVINLSNTGFFGDEYYSLIELVHPGLAPHSTVFFSMLRLWAGLGGQSLEWLRLFSALWAAGLAVAVYGIGFEATGNRSVACIVGLVATLSPWRVEQGQEVRSYAWFMFVAALFLWSLLHARRVRTPAAWVVMVLTALLTTSAHLLGILFVVTGLIFALWPGPVRRRWLLLITAGAVAVILGLLSAWVPASALQAAYQVVLPFESTTYAGRVFTGPRGVSVSTLIKPAYAFYSYTLGPSFYPFDFVLSLPALLVTGAAMAVGLWQLRRRPESLVLISAWFIVPVVSLFFALDSLAPPGYVPAGAQHIAPAALAPWVVIGSLAAYPRWRSLCVAALAVNLIGLGYYYLGDWSLNSRKDVDLRAAAAQANRAGCGPEAVLIPDGLMIGPAQVYAAAGCHVKSVYQALANPTPLTTSQVGLWYTYWAGDKTSVPAFQHQLSTEGYSVQDRWQSGLAVVETYQRAASALLPDGQLSLPWSPPPLYFFSLRLPLPASTGVPVLGAVVMRSGEQTELALTLPARTRWSGVSLTTSTFRMVAGPVGTVEALLADGQTITLSIAQGQNTADWAAASCPACTVAFSWRKRLDRLGRSAYPGAWQDFIARGFATEWNWGAPESLVALRVRLAPEAQGDWWVWQIVPRSP